MVNLDLGALGPSQWLSERKIRKKTFLKYIMAILVLNAYLAFSGKDHCFYFKQLVQYRR